MSDGVTVTPSPRGVKIATDELATLNGAPVPEPVHVQRMKVGFGPDNDFRDVDEGHPLPVEVSFPATQAVSAVALPLPTGAATAANQTAGNNLLTAIGDLLAGTLGISGSVTVTNLPGTQAISASSLPLPSGAATAALQTTGNTTLAAIQSSLAGTLGIAGSVTVSNFPAIQAISAASLPLPVGAATAANQTSGNATLTAISGQLPATLGQKAMAASLPVTLASDQSALPVTVVNFPATQAITAASLPLPTGAATAAAQTAGNTSLANIDADIGAIGDVAAAAEGTGNYSIIAGIKRALLNWASLLARIPASLGQKNMAGSLPVVLASDQSALSVSLPSMGATTIPANTSLDARRFSNVEFVPSTANVSVTRSYDNSIFYAHPVSDPLGNFGSGTMNGTTGAVGFWTVDGDAYLRFSADVLAIGRA